MATQNKIEIVLSAITQGFEQRLRAASDAVKGLGAAASQSGAGISAARRGVESISTKLDSLKNKAIAVFSVNAVLGWAGQFVAAADAMRNLDQRLLLTAKNTADYAAAQKTVVDVAAASHQGLAEVGTLYTRMALATANLNVSQQELAEVTRTVALATAMSGASTSEASAGLQQFAQAMGAGKLQGDELRSVLENMPMLTKVFVDAAGGSIAKLREMAENGELTTQWTIDAIKAAKETIEAQAAAMPLTVGRAMTDLRNEASKYVDSVNQATGATDIMANSIQWLGKNLDLVAKGGALALSTALSVLVGRGLTAAVASTTEFITSLGATATAATTAGVAVSSASAYMSGSYAPAAATVATTTASRLLPALTGLINPITAVTTVLGIGAAAWMMWGRSADDELAKAKSRLSELQRTNQMLKELSDPGIRLQETSQKILAAKTEVAKLEKDLAEASAGQTYTPDDGGIGSISAQLDAAQQKLKVLEQEHAATQENIKITAEQTGAKQVAVEMSVTDAIKKQDEERRKVTASKLENDLAEIETKRKAELKSIESQFKGEDLLRVQKAVNARFDAAAGKAKEEAADKAGKADERAAKKAEAEAKRKEREMLKDEKLQGKIDIEKLRAQSESTLLSLEQQKLDADGSATELERATKLLELNKQISQVKIKLLEDEQQRIKADPSKTEADVIRAESAILKEKIDQAKQEHSDMADVARASLAEVELAWRRGQVSVEKYQQALVAAREANIITAEEMREKTIASGNDMGVALSLGFERAREKMQTDAEVMIQIGEQIGDQISGGLVSAWDSFISRSASAKEAFLDFARSTISWLSQIILKQMLLNAIGFGSTTAANGTVTAGTGLLGMLGFAGGGSIPGMSPSKTSDNIPIWATAGEFMQPVAAVDYYGINFMELIRRRLFPRHIAIALAGGTLPRIPSGNRLAGGGQPAAAPATTIKSGDTRLRVINVLDRNMVGDFLRTADGETAILNMIRRNGTTIRTLIGG
jgi:tape measure domain-containing protein